MRRLRTPQIVAVLSKEDAGARTATLVLLHGVTAQTPYRRRLWCPRKVEQIRYSLKRARSEMGAR